MGPRPTQGDGNRVAEAWLATTPNFVISTGAKRSGEICGFPHLAQRARQICGTLDWWQFWIHFKKDFECPRSRFWDLGFHKNDGLSASVPCVVMSALGVPPAKRMARRNRRLCAGS